ncbi:hypothetical protein WJX72_004868 [[Myrmecia] bisecta]|uniref:Bulb-type lectin domain-containing protein n=1 Tax=[Myrmecia] bisecta TaxID=41462 RepID=A0AAW1P5X7_9CHLO
MDQLAASLRLNQSDVLAIASNKALTAPSPSALGSFAPISCGDLFKNAVNLFANLLQNKDPVSFACSTQAPIAEYPAFVRVALSVNLPGINFVPISGSTDLRNKWWRLHDVLPPGQFCGWRQLRQRYTGSDPATKQLYDLVSTILRLLGLDLCPIHGGATIFPSVLIFDGYLQIGIGFVDIRADVEVKFAPDNGFTTQICDYLETGYDTPTNNPAFKQVQYCPWCYQKFGDGTFKVAAELHILWFAWSWTLFQTSFGSNAQPLLCAHPPVGVYGPANGRNDTLYGPAVIPLGTELISANGNFLLRFGSDGNVALYDSQTPGTFPDVQPADFILWLTATGGQSASFQLFDGGNLQVRDASGTSLWQLGDYTYTLGKPYITVTNDGRVLLRDTYNNKCYWDSTGQCQDGLAYWPSGFSDSLVEISNHTDPNYKPTCIDNTTMLVSKYRLYSFVGNGDSWYVQGQGQPIRQGGSRVQGKNHQFTLRRTVTCKAGFGHIGSLCISSRPFDYTAYILSNDPSPKVLWSALLTVNLEGAQAPASPLHVTLDNDGNLGLWDYNGKQIFLYGTSDGTPDKQYDYAHWFGNGQDVCAYYNQGDDALP